MFHRFPVHRIADHLGEGGNTWIVGDEAMVPTLFRRTDRHQFEPSLPDDPAAQPLEYRPAFPAVGRICFGAGRDRKSTRLNSSHSSISYAVFCLKKKKTT